MGLRGRRDWRNGMGPEDGNGMGSEDGSDCDIAYGQVNSDRRLNKVLTK